MLEWNVCWFYTYMHSIYIFILLLPYSFLFPLHMTLRWHIHCHLQSKYIVQYCIIIIFWLKETMPAIYHQPMAYYSSFVSSYCLCFHKANGNFYLHQKKIGSNGHLYSVLFCLQKSLCPSVPVHCLVTSYWNNPAKHLLKVQGITN